MFLEYFTTILLPDLIRFCTNHPAQHAMKPFMRQSINERAWGLEVSNIEGWKAIIHSIESLMEETKLSIFHRKLLLCGNIYWGILKRRYASCSVFVRISFNGKNLQSNKVSYAKTGGMKWLVGVQQRHFPKYSCIKSPKPKAMLLLRDFMLST